MCGPGDRLGDGEKEGGQAVIGRQSHEDVVTTQTRAVIMNVRGGSRPCTKMVRVGGNKVWMGTEGE